MPNVLSPALVAVYALVASALYVHFRGRDRHPFTRQLTDHSTFLAPFNLLIYLFSAVPNRPFIETERFSDLALLRENWQVFREEALNLYEQGGIAASESYDDLGFNSFFKKGWRRFYLSWYGEPLPSAQAMCPRSVALLAQVPSVKAAMFAVLPPGGKLVRHRDPYAGSLRYHLGLATPNSAACRILIDGTPYHWRDGEDLVFDETYIHSAVNESDQTRIILFCDIERPLHTAAARAVNRFIATRVLPATATKNQPGERVGALNKLFGLVYPVRLRIKRFKHANRRLYYRLKYAGVALALGLVVWSAI